jgi:hypothetical protein
MSDQQRAGEVPETSELRYQKLGPETHTKGQATQHGCQPSLLGDGDLTFGIGSSAELGMPRNGLSPPE